MKDFTRNELTEVLQDDDQPQLKRHAANAMLGGDAIEYLRLLLEHLDGKPKQALDVTSGGEKLKGYVGISPDDWDSISTSAAKPASDV